MGETQPARSLLIRSARRPPSERQHDCELRTLERVYAVGETREASGVTFTLLSPERYDDGFVVQMRVRTDSEGADIAMPHFLPLAVDDRGGRYTPWPHGGSGGGRPGRMEWRYAYRFAPALSREATVVRVDIPDLGLMRHDRERGDLVGERTIVGPLSFVVPVGDATGSSCATRDWGSASADPHQGQPSSSTSRDHTVYPFNESH